MADTPQIIPLKKSSKRISNESIDTQGSSFILHSPTGNIEDINDQTNWNKKKVGEYFQLDPISQSIEINTLQFEAPMKSIFPSTCYLSRSSKMHRRYLSTPPDVLPPNFLINCLNRRKKSDRRTSEKVFLSSSLERDKQAKSFYSEQVLNIMNLKSHRLAENDEIMESFDGDFSFKTHIKDASAKKYKKSCIENEDASHSLPALGSSPCTVYCEFCKIDVHSIVTIHNTSKFAASLLNIFQNIIGCCSNFVWLNNTRYHRCSNCGTILGRSIA